MRKNIEQNRAGKRFILIPLISALLILCSCGGSGSAIQETPELKTPVGVTVDTEPVKRGDIVKQMAYQAEVLPVTHELYFAVDGCISAVRAYRGQYVEEGDVLIELDPSSLEREIESLEELLSGIIAGGDFEDRLAELSIEYCELELQEALERYGENSAEWQLKNTALKAAVLDKEQSTEKREAEIRELESRIGELRENEGKLVICAPCSGHFYCEDTVTEGAYVGSGKTVAYVVDPADLRVVVSGESVSGAILESGAYYAWIGGGRWEITYMPLTTEEKNSYILAKQVAPTFFSIEGDWEDEISAGMSAAVLGEYKRVEDVLYVLKDSLLSDDGGSFVYVIGEDNAREKRYITVGFSNELYAEVSEGLGEGELVYVEE